MGPQIEVFDGVQTTNSAKALLFGTDERFGSLKKSGITLLECFCAYPGMHSYLYDLDVNSNIVRGSISRKVERNGSDEITLTIHPERQELLEQFYERLKIRANTVDLIDTIELESEMVIKIDMRHYTSGLMHSEFPYGIAWNSNQIRFPPELGLNEFGIIYTGLFILGNYARYYPDRWMRDVETGSPLAQAAERFMQLSEWRMALLTLSDFRGVYLVPGG